MFANIARAFPVIAAALVAPFGLTHAAAAPIRVVAAENVYGDVARQIGGTEIEVTSILSSSDQDPHLFEIAPGILRQIAGARLVVYNGADYDPWVEKLLQAAPRADRLVIDASRLTHRRAGDNPHIWYDPATMPVIARALAAALTKLDPAHGKDYDARLSAFLASLKPIDDRIATIRAKHAGTAVEATEPVFGLMAAALGLSMRNEAFQRAIMNDTEPAARDVAAFERDLRERRVRVLFYNKQASDKIVERLLSLAREAKVPVVGVTELVPPGMTFQDWMLSELDATEKALAGPNS
jgi:zinc/manganese transport system substrate-binding protein